MTPVDPSGGSSCPSHVAAAGGEFPVATTTASDGDKSIPMRPVNPNGGSSCPSQAADPGGELPVATTITSEGDKSTPRTPVDPSHGSCPSHAPAAGSELPVATTITSEGDKSTPMTPVDPSNGSCPSLVVSAGGELPVAATTTSKGDDEEWMWESDWVSEWESDWVSGSEKDPFVKNAKVIQSDDSEPKIKRLRCVKTLIGDDDRNSPTIKTGIRESKPTSDEEGEVEEDESTGDDSVCSEASSEDFHSEEEAALTPGRACHYCLQRNVKRKVQCSRCPLRFCGLCLLKRNGEMLEVETREGVKWVCPKCRGGCGPGCICCCTCAKCRKSRGLPPTGQVLRLAQATGFDNVHDYLIHRETGESPEKLAKRKDGKCWTNLGGGMSTRSLGTLKPAQFWADCAPANPLPPKKIVERKKRRVKAGAAMCSCSRSATVANLKPAQFWADCPTNRAAVECDNRQIPERFPKKREGRGGIKGGGCDIPSSSTAANIGMLNSAQFSGDCTTANLPTAEFHDENSHQKNGLQSWAVPKAVGEIWKSTDENAKRGDGKRGGVVLPSGDVVKKGPPNVAGVLKSHELERAVNEKKNVLDQILGREAQKPRTPLRIKVSLDQIVNRLLETDDQAGRDRSGALLRGIRQIRRNRKHRKMGRILEPSLFRNRRPKKVNAKNLNNATPALPPPVPMQDTNRDLSSKTANNITSEKKPVVQPAAQNAISHNAQDGFRRLIPLKRPVTSLQALRKMGILPKRKNGEISGAQPPQTAQKCEELPRPLLSLANHWVRA